MPKCTQKCQQNFFFGSSDCLLAFKVFNREDIRQVSVLDNITDSQTELKLLTCINRRGFRCFSYSCIRL